MANPKLLIVIASTRPGRVGRLVNIPWVHSKLKDGVLVEDTDLRAAADAMLDELLTLEAALKTLR